MTSLTSAICCCAGCNPLGSVRYTFQINTAVGIGSAAWAQTIDCDCAAGPFVPQICINTINPTCTWGAGVSSESLSQIAQDCCFYLTQYGGSGGYYKQSVAHSRSQSQMTVDIPYVSTTIGSLSLTTWRAFDGTTYTTTNLGCTLSQKTYTYSQAITAGWNRSSCDRGLTYVGFNYGASTPVSGASCNFNETVSISYKDRCTYLTSPAFMSIKRSTGGSARSYAVIAGVFYLYNVSNVIVYSLNLTGVTLLSLFNSINTIAVAIRPSVTRLSFDVATGGVLALPFMFDRAAITLVPNASSAVNVDLVATGTQAEIYQWYYVNPVWLVGTKEFPLISPYATAFTFKTAPGQTSSYDATTTEEVFCKGFCGEVFDTSNAYGAFPPYGESLYTGGTTADHQWDFSGCPYVWTETSCTSGPSCPTITTTSWVGQRASEYKTCTDQIITAQDWNEDNDTTTSTVIGCDFECSFCDSGNAVSHCSWSWNFYDWEISGIMKVTRI